MCKKILTAIIILLYAAGFYLLCREGVRISEEAGLNFFMSWLGAGCWFLAIITRFILNQIPDNPIPWDKRKRRALGLKT